MERVVESHLINFGANFHLVQFVGVYGRLEFVLVTAIERRASLPVTNFNAIY